MSAWNSHSCFVPGTSLLQHSAGGVLSQHSAGGVLGQHSAGGVLGQYRPIRLEAEMTDVEAYLLPTTPVDESAFAVRDERAEFCNKNNMLNSVEYVNQELELLGLECVKHDNTKCTSDAVFFVNRLHDLLTLFHKTAAFKEELEARNHRLRCETDHHQATALRAKRLQEQTERELGQEREKMRQISLKYNQVCINLKAEKEDVRKLTAVLQSRDLQHKHEQKKKEREVHRLKERLHQLLADKVPDRKVGMDLMNIVGKRSEEGRRATWKAGPEKQEEEMYQILVNSYEERHQELMQENGDLRDCLLSLQRELSALVKCTGDFSVASVLNMSSHTDPIVPSEDSEHSIQSRLSITELDEGYFQMPYDIVRHEIERTFKETCDHISNSMKKSLIRNVAKGHPSISLSKSSGSNSSEKDHLDKRRTSETSELERLRKQVMNYKAIIQQQEDLLRHSITSHSQFMENSFPLESQQGNLSELNRFSTDEKTSFDKERKAFTEAAIHLSKERQLLQEERAKLIKQHFLNISSFKQNQQHKLKEDGHSSRLLPATPIFSPAKSSSKVPGNYRSSTDICNSLGLFSLADQNSRNLTSAQAQSDKQGHLNARSRVTLPASVPATNFTVATQSADSLTHASSISSPPNDDLTRTEDIKVFLMSSKFHKTVSED